MMRRIKSLVGVTRNGQSWAWRAMPLLFLIVVMLWAVPVFAQDADQGDSTTMRVITLAETRPVAQGVALLLGGVTLYAGGLLLMGLRQRHMVAWRTSLKMAGWIVPLITAAVTLAMILNRDTVRITPMITMSVLQLLLPLGAAIQTALIFVPEDEPLEMLLALPRPITWLVFERLVVIILIYGGIGVASMGLLAAQDRLGDAPQRVGAWLPSMLFLMTFTIYLTTRTRTMTMGLVGGIAVWGISLLFGPLLMPNVTPAGAETPFPINYVQPFLWMVNIFAQPLLFPAWEYYTLNRAILLGLSVFWLWRTAAQLASPETLLLSVQDRQTRRRSKPAEVVPHKRSLKFNPAPVSLSIVWQIAAMCLYEAKLHWRRRALKVVFFTLVITMTLVLLISYEAFLRVMLPGVSLFDLALDQQMIIKGVILARAPIVLFALMQMVILPVLLSDTVPLDHQDHMDEILHSTPLPGWAYLVGKVGGVWWAGMSALTLATPIICVVGFLMVGPYDVLPVLDAWLLLSMPIVLFNGGFAALIGATQPTRRRAVVAVIVVMAVCVFLDARITEGPLVTLHLSPFSNSILSNVFDANLLPPVSYSSLLMHSGMMDYILGRAVVFLITALMVGTWWKLRESGISLRPKTREIVPPVPAQQGS